MLYHVLISKTKKAQGSSSNPTQLSTNQGNPGSGNYEDDIFAYAPLGPNPDNEDDSSVRMISNVQRLIEGKIDVTSKDFPNSPPKAYVHSNDIGGCYGERHISLWY